MSPSDLSAAEFLLSLVGQPGTAPSIIGDLAEESHHRSRLQFWYSILRTVASTIARDLFDSPLRTFGSVIYGWGLWVFLLLITAQIAVLQPSLIRSGGSLLPAISYLFLFRVAFLVAKRSLNREIAAAIAYILFRLLFHGVALALSAMQERRIGKPYLGIHDTDFVLTGALFLVAAILSRLHTLHARKSHAVQA